MGRKSNAKKDQEIIDEALERFDDWWQADSENRALWLEDVKFVDDPNGQWTDEMKAKREKRPCFTVDRTSPAVHQVVGDMLMNTPSLKVRPGEDGDTDVADIYTGLIRAIENKSEAKRAHNVAYKFAVKGGRGVWRIRPEYCDEDGFDQELRIEMIENPLSVVTDPYRKFISGEDARGGFIFDDIPKNEFEREYPKADSSSTFEQASGSSWSNDKTVRIAEYYRRVADGSETLLLLSNGEPILASEWNQLSEEQQQASGLEVVNQREVTRWRVEWYKLTGKEILERRVDYPGKYVPIVVTYGRNVNIDGKFIYSGLVRSAKDSQRVFNLEISNTVEMTAMQPRAPFMATPAMVKGYEGQWKKINTSNDPLLVFNPDPEFPGQRPWREPPPALNQASMNIAMMMGDNIKAVTGIHDASLGARSNESSGKAIMARDRQGDVSTYEFADELAEAIQYEGKIMMDLIPKIYDGDRAITILGEDMSEEVKQINTPRMDAGEGRVVKDNDLTIGKYDLYMDTGPSFTTKREETREQLGQIMAQNPAMAEIIGDIWIKSMDIVDGEEVRERLRKMGIKKGLIEPNDEEKQEMAQANQAQERMKQQAMHLQMRAETAETAKDESIAALNQAKAKETESQTLLNQIQAQLDQVELAMAQGNAEQLVAQLTMMRRLMTPQQPQMMPMAGRQF